MIIKIPNETEVFICSDLHYNHANLCLGTTKYLKEDRSNQDSFRQFTTLEDMNNTIVNNINKTVGKDATLIFVGDWSFGGWENIQKFRELIICNNIIFVYGNHDEHVMKNKDNLQSLFTICCDYLILNYHKKRIIIFHTPIASWDGLAEGSIHLHGHLHSKTKDRIFGRSMDIGIDGHPEFRPYNLVKEVFPLVENNPIQSRIVEEIHVKNKF